MTLLAQTSGTTTTLFASQLTQDDPGVFSTGGIVFFVVLAVGLFQVFELGLLEIKAHVIDSLAYPDRKSVV